MICPHLLLIFTIFTTLTLSLPTLHKAEEPALDARTTDEVVDGALNSTALDYVLDMEGLGNPSAVETDDTPSHTDLAAAAYTAYVGDGSPSAGWPIIDEWKTYEELWSLNQDLIASSCTDYGANSADETNDINRSIYSISNVSLVDSRFIFATIMQESKGCVRVSNTISPDGSTRNPGLMQDHEGGSSCAGITPCPSLNIIDMITEGTQGTTSGSGLAGALNAAGAVGAKGSKAFYWASYTYNSGAAAPFTDLSGGSGSEYASQVANRLMGAVF